MDETKYGNLFHYGYGVVKRKKEEWARTVNPKDETHLLRIDQERIEGLPFFAQCNWFWPSLIKGDIEQRSTKPHSHKYDEIIGMVGTNPDDPNELCGEIEITINGEKHIVTKSCFIYLPAGLEHGPFRELRIDRPIFEFEFGLHGQHD